jgi:hypothetical protein
MPKLNDKVALVTGGSQAGISYRLEHPSPGHFDTLSVYPAMGRGQQRRDNRPALADGANDGRHWLRRTDSSLFLPSVWPRACRLSLAPLQGHEAGRDSVQRRPFSSARNASGTREQ